MSSLCISPIRFTACSTIKWLYFMVAMPVKTRSLTALTLYMTLWIHGLWECKTASFHVSYPCHDRMSTECLFALTLYISQSIYGLRHCKMALFNISYACQDRISLCIHSLCISHNRFTALSTVKQLHSVLAMPVRTGCLFVLTLHISQSIDGLKNCKTALFNVSSAGLDRVGISALTFCIIMRTMEV